NDCGRDGYCCRKASSATDPCRAVRWDFGNHRGGGVLLVGPYVPPLNPCWRKASNNTSAAQFDRFNERASGLNIGIRSQRSRFPSSSFFGKPAVSRPKTRKSCGLN